MKRNIFFSGLFYLFIFLSTFLIICGCSTHGLKIESDKPLPQIIKAYKHITLRAGDSGMRNTGVFIDAEDLFTIMATGRMDYCPGRNCGYHNVKPEDGWPIMAKIGKEGIRFRPISNGLNSNTDIRYDSGYLFLGYKQGKVDSHGKALNPQYYQNDSGAFYINVIVWKKDDYVQISSFLEKMKEKDPDNKAILDALKFANIYKDLYIAETEASKEVDKTKKMLRKLEEAQQKKEPDIETTPDKKPAIQDKPSTVDLAHQEKIKELETKLSKLMKTLAQLNKMKKQLEEEKKKTKLLTQELEEKDERERELLSKLEDGPENPPILVIASPSDGKITESKVIQLSGVAEDDQGLERLEILINNKILSSGNDRGIKVTGKSFPRRLDFNERIPLQKGINYIKIRAVDSKGLISEKVLTIDKIEIRRNIWAVVIGINDYSKIRKLKYAVNDAKAFYEFLLINNKIPPENITILIDQEASLFNLRSTLGTKLKSNAGKEDTVIIYFAGHGATEKDVMSPDGDGLEKYLLPYDADLRDLYSSALPMREISHIFRRIRSERLIFIADSCYSGATGGRTVSYSGIRASISDAFLDRISRGKGTVIITASSANEVSAENEEFQHGIFTYYLIEGLQGKADTDNDGLITVDEAYRYVSEQVTRATGNEQHPIKKGSVEGSLILSIIQ